MKVIKAIIDTNVLLIANEDHANVSPECVIACITRLATIKKNGVVVIDDDHHILGEYQNKTKLSPPKGTGDVFLKWLLRNANNRARVHQVHITETAPFEFSEFPDKALEPQFDKSDRKFAAVANVHIDKPSILQAADCKWLNWWQALHSKGITIEFLCPDDACRFYTKKFPQQALPALPSTK